VVNCLMCFGVGMSAFCLKKKKKELLLGKILFQL